MWAQDRFRCWGHNINHDPECPFTVQSGGREGQAVNEQGGSARTTWNSGLGRALCQGHGEEGLASLPEETVCEPRPKRLQELLAEVETGAGWDHGAKRAKPRDGEEPARRGGRAGRSAGAGGAGGPLGASRICLSLRGWEGSPAGSWVDVTTA